MVTHTQEKRTSDNYTSICIVTNVFSLATPFQLSPYNTCVNTQISKAVMATAFESVQSIAVNIMPFPRSWIMLYDISSKQLEGIASLQSCLFPSKPLYATISYFFRIPPFHLSLFHVTRIEICSWKIFERKVDLIHLSFIYNLNSKFKWIPVNSLGNHYHPVSLHRVLIN